MPQKHDIVYPYKHEPGADNALRFSLRSLSKHYPLRRHVYVVGPQLPEWCTNVFHVRTVQNHSSKYLDTHHKWETICKREDVTDDFLAMNDDFYFMKSCRKAPHYHGGDYFEWCRNEQWGGRYLKIVERTKKVLNEGAKAYSIHVPMLFNREKWLHMATAYDIQRQSLSPRNVYGNLYRAEHGEGKKLDDVKVSSMGALLVLMEDNPPFLSSADKLESDPSFIQWMEHRFREKSEYEK